MSEETKDGLGAGAEHPDPQPRISDASPPEALPTDAAPPSEAEGAKPAGDESVVPPPPISRTRIIVSRTLIWSARIAAAGTILGLVLLVCVFAWHARDLPGFETLADYRPLQSTRIVTADGEVVGELFIERRTVVPFDAIPQTLLDAFIAAEDERFYEHVGLDYLGILRALVRNVQAGGVKEGASTITQQVVKTFLLSPERRYSRKFREMILARRLEQNLTKDEILYLYLNQIYFGHGRYGVQEASRFYFGKDVGELELAEAAMLAALPRAPNLYSPRRYPHRALGRRAYVLRRMVEAGMVDQETAHQAATGPLSLSSLPARAVGEGYVEEVRRLLDARFGSQKLLGGGLTVEVAMDPRLQAAAEKALAEGLRAIDKRQGWRGAITRLDPFSREAVANRFDELSTIRIGRGHTDTLIFDLSEIVAWDRDEEAPPPIGLLNPEPDLVVAGIVSGVEDRRAEVDLGGASVRLLLPDMRWARPFSPEEQSPAPRRVGEVLSVGDVVLVRIGERIEDEESGEGGEGTEEARRGPLFAAVLEQHPAVEGALVAIDPAGRDVVAMVGGYDPQRSQFNRATQARRQPGSAFKPFVYGAAIQSRRFTAGSMVIDAPEMFRDPWTGDTWRPSNYDGRYDGDMTLRASLAASKNAVAVRMANEIGVDSIIDFARRCGITSHLPRFLPLALGSGEVTPLELVNAYATLSAGGRRDEPVLVRSVRDRAGKEIFRHVGAPEHAISEETSYVLTSLLTSVLTEGTGRSLNRLGRPTAGKTGTTDDRRDAWFVGYTSDLVAGVWVGFDEPQPLGRAEYGGRAAGPAWLAFMQDALKDSPPRAFETPPGLLFVRVDPKNGLLAPPGHPGIYEPFLPDTAPLLESTPDALSPLDLLFGEP